MLRVLRVLKEGESGSKEPFTILMIANPSLETPWKSGRFASDGICNNQTAFDACCDHIEKALFGLLAHQAEALLSDPAISSKVRLVSWFETGLPAGSANALVAEDSYSQSLIGRRQVLLAFLRPRKLSADVVYAVSSSPGRTRASAWPASDDDSSKGVPFLLDGNTFHHRQHVKIPGMVALHSSARSLTPLHEFGHALGSYTNGLIVDLYVDTVAAVNNKRGRPIPNLFCTYACNTNLSVPSDPVRDSLGYPGNWLSYHSQLHAPAYPAIMDNYPLARNSGGKPEQCEHDVITRQFLLDRIKAKCGR